MRFDRREVYYRERAAGYYAPEAWTLSSFLVEVPWLAVLVLTSVSISFYMVGLPQVGAGAFFFFYLAACVVAFFFLATGLAYSAIFPILPIAQIVGGLTLSISFLFA
jgi:ABC-type multidrug transport system permease subunit